MKLVASLVLGACLLLDGCTNQVQRNMKEYIDTTLPRIMQQQEQKLGIKYTEVPQIIVSSTPTNKSDTVADYDSISNKMLVYSSRNFTEDDINRSLSHELGHFYSDRLLESSGFQNGLNSDDTLNVHDLKNQKEILRKLLIGEGIAEYFSRNTLDIQNDCPNISLEYDIYRDRFKSRGSLNNAFLSNAYCLVKPVLDMNLNKGIVYLATHPPNEDQLEHLKTYQENAENEIRAILIQNK
jgi:hypothetical protein